MRSLASVLFLLLSAACSPNEQTVESSSQAPTPAPTPITEPVQSAPPVSAPATPEAALPEGACETLPRAACLESRVCTMVHVRDTPGATTAYECRPASGPCEVDLVQSDAGACRARPGCEFVPAKCYCQCAGYGQTQVPDAPEQRACKCNCGVGPPAMCRETGRPRPPPPPGARGGSCGGGAAVKCTAAMVCAYPGGRHPGAGVCSDSGEVGTACGSDLPSCQSGLECRELSGGFRQCEP